MITVVVVLLLVLLFFRGRGAPGVPKEFDGAPIAIGTVIAVTGTGRSVRGRPRLDLRLRVDTADGRTFTTTMRQAGIATMAPNALLPVRYLLDGRVTPAVDAPAHELQAVLDRVHVAKGWLTPRQLRITAYGVDASARVVAATPPEPTEDGRAAVRLRMVVTRPDGTTFELTQDKRLAPSSVPQLRPGMVVRVKYLPHDESDVAVLTKAAP